MPMVYKTDKYIIFLNVEKGNDKSWVLSVDLRGCSKISHKISALCLMYYMNCNLEINNKRENFIIKCSKKAEKSLNFSFLSQKSIVGALD